MNDAIDYPSISDTLTNSEPAQVLSLHGDAVLGL